MIIFFNLFKFIYKLYSNNNNYKEFLINISDFLFLNIFKEKNNINNLIGIYESYEEIKKNNKQKYKL